MTTIETKTDPSSEPVQITTMEQLLDGANDLAALPQVVMKVIDLTADPKVTASDLERVIGTDQVMAGKVLALANSPYYGLPRRVSSLREAVVFLGFKSVRNLAMTITTFNVFLGKSDAPALARRALWRHSLDTAQCARVITGLLRLSDHETFGTEEAYACGLLHDIGKMVIDRSKHAVFVAITQMARVQSVRFHEVEADVFPFNHSQIGLALAARWNLPPAICEAVAFHHTPRAAEINLKLTSTICLANEVAHYLEPGAAQSEERFQELLRRSEDALVPLHLSAEGVQAMAGACRAELEKGLSLLSFGK